MNNYFPSPWFPVQLSETTAEKQQLERDMGEYGTGGKKSIKKR